jgi:hypothetical protein
MYLSNFNSVPDAAEWLSENTHELWSCNDVVRILSEIGTDKVLVNIPPAVLLLKLLSGEISEYVVDNNKIFEICNPIEFLENILMGDDFESACANPSALVCDAVLYRSPSPISASAIRLTKTAIYRLAEHSPLESFEKLVKEIQKGNQSELATLASEWKVASPSAVAEIIKPLQRRKAQEDAILAEIYHLQFDPLSLPKNVSGKPGVRAAVRKSLEVKDAKGYASTFSSPRVYVTAWQRLLTAPCKIRYE